MKPCCKAELTAAADELMALWHDGAPGVAGIEGAVRWLRAAGATGSAAEGAEVDHEWLPCPRHMIPTDCGTCCEEPYHKHPPQPELLAHFLPAEPGTHPFEPSGGRVPGLRGGWEHRCTSLTGPPRNGHPTMCWEREDHPVHALAAGEVEGVASVVIRGVRYTIWCQCYGTPEPERWIHPDDEHADICGIDALNAQRRRRQRETRPVPMTTEEQP